MLLIMQFPPVSSVFHPPRPKYLPQISTLKQPHLHFFPQCEQSSFKPIQNNMQNHSSVLYLILLDRKWDYKCILAEWSRYTLYLQFCHKPFNYLWKLFFDEIPFLLSTNSGVNCTSSMQTNVDGCLANTTTARVDQH